MKVEEIRAKYPNPMRAGRATYSVAQEKYCVGGALGRCLFEEGKCLPFPGYVELACYLRTANPMLEANLSWQAAMGIIAANDDGDFESAWSIMAQAIKEE